MTGAIGPAGGATCGISIVGGTAMCWTLPALLWALLAAGLTLLLLLLLLGLLVGWCLRAAATPSGAGAALRSRSPSGALLTGLLLSATSWRGSSGALLLLLLLLHLLAHHLCGDAAHLLLSREGSSCSSSSGSCLLLCLLLLALRCCSGTDLGLVEAQLQLHEGS